MQTKIVGYAALISLGFATAVWAAPAAPPISPVQASETPLIEHPQQKSVTPPVLPRGQLLYENHCTLCHESVVHIRRDRRLRSLQELRGTVSSWADYLRLGWRSEEVDDVVTYLNGRHYGFESR